MTCLWILSFLHIFILAAVSPAAETIPGGVATCEELAAKAGKPVNGWKIIVDANGDQQCQRITVDLMCLGQQIYDPVSLQVLETNVIYSCDESCPLDHSSVAMLQSTTLGDMD